MLSNEYSAAVKKAEALQAEIDKLITYRIRERAAEISGVPSMVLRRMLEGRSCGYCRCMALKNVANETDGL
jgi:DNA helicase TIP49 (TBP-interacting protein)